jgi:hypothetical protein
LLEAAAEESTMSMSNLEKRAGWLLFGLLLSYGIYFARVLRNVGQSRLAGEALGSVIVGVVAIIGIEILYHIAAPPAGVPPEPKDERDVVIESKAYRNAYFAYGTGACLVISAVIAAGHVGMMVTPFLVVNLVLLLMVLSEAIKLGSQLLYYRKGF